MVSLGDFIPFYPKKEAESKRSKFDPDRALNVELHPHPTLEQHRAANGELVLVILREYSPGEKFIERFFKVNRQRRLVLDKYGEFMLKAAFRPGATLADAAVSMSKEFDIELDTAKTGVIQMVKDLMLRGFVFIVRK